MFIAFDGFIMAMTVHVFCGGGCKLLCEVWCLRLVVVWCSVVGGDCLLEGGKL